MFLEKYPDILTVPQTCEALNIGKALLYKLLSSGEIYSVKVGRAYRIPKKSLENYIFDKGA